MHDSDSDSDSDQIIAMLTQLSRDILELIYASYDIRGANELLQLSRTASISFNSSIWRLVLCIILS